MERLASGAERMSIHIFLQMLSGLDSLRLAETTLLCPLLWLLLTKPFSEEGRLAMLGDQREDSLRQKEKLDWTAKKS